MTPPDDDHETRKGNTTPGDYAVGYGRPPKHSRFQPGRSGNPNGRPRGALNLGTTLQQALGEQVPVTENGRTRKIRKMDLMVTTALNRAIKGDARALNAMIALMQRTGIGIGVGEPDTPTDTFSPDDAEALARYLADCRPDDPPGSPSQGPSHAA